MASADQEQASRTADWTAVLADLEEQTDFAELWLQAYGADAAEGPEARNLPVTGWVPPTGLGPVPAELVERLLSLHTRHRDVTERMARTREGVGEALGAARQVLATQAPAPGIYLDTKG